MLPLIKTFKIEKRADSWFLSLSPSFTGLFRCVQVNDCELLKVLNQEETSELLSLGKQKADGPVLTLYSAPGVSPDAPLSMDPDPSMVRSPGLKLSLARLPPRRLSPIPTATPTSPVPSTVLPFPEKAAERPTPDLV